MKLRFVTLLTLVLLTSSCRDKEPVIEIEEPDAPANTAPEPGTTFWWNEAVFYEIFVRSFYDSDGDGIGDIQGIIQKLDYLNDGNPNTDTDLGITGIWLMPIAESPSYHGYDVVDYRTIDQEYGTNQDFLELMDQAHSRGIKIIIDLVVNHSSSQHPWFIESQNPESPYRDWYIWSSFNPGYIGPWGQQVWHSFQDMYYYGVFWSGMPDLNYKSEAVREEMKSIATYWLTDMKADGFRLDAAKHIVENGSDQDNTAETLDWWTEFNGHFKNVNPNALAVGEVWDATSVVLDYLDERLDYCFEFDLALDILNGINSQNPMQLKVKMQEMIEAYPYHQYGTFLTNHDQNRVFNTLGYDEGKAKLAAAIYITLPGIPYIYYGEEVGMVGQKPDEMIRRPMQWNNEANAGFTTGTPWQQVVSSSSTFNVARMQGNKTSIWRRYERLIKARNNYAALRSGTYQLVESNDSNVYAYFRYADDHGILVIHNFSDQAVENLKLSLITTRLEEHNYSLIDLLTNEPLGTAEVNTFGGFKNLEIGPLAGNESFVLIFN